VPAARTEVRETQALVGSGSLPTEALPSLAVAVDVPGVPLSELARRLRLDRACVFGRIEEDRFLLDVRTITDAQVETIAGALARIVQTPKGDAGSGKNACDNK
jgi:L-seryl-tRNA(Ser) seleniumtransferase